MDGFISVTLYLGTVALLLTGIVLLWIDRRQRIAAERELLAQRSREMIDEGVQSILEREARSIAAAAQRRQQVTGDARWQFVATWLSDILRMNDTFEMRNWSVPGR